MKRFFLVVFAIGCFSGFGISAQNSHIAHIDTLIKNGLYKEALYKCRNQQTAQQNNLPEHTRLLFREGLIYYNKGQMMDALNCFNQCIQQSAKFKNKTVADYCDYCVYYQYATLSVFRLDMIDDVLNRDYGDITLKAFNKAIRNRAFEVSDKLDFLDYIDNELGGMLSSLLVNQEDAMYYFNKASASAIEHFGKNSFQYAEILELMGQIHMRVSDFEQAVNYYTQAAGIYAVISRNEDLHLANVQLSLGTIYFNLGNLDKAIDYYTTAQQMYTSRNNLDNIFYAQLLINMGLAYKEMGEYNQALSFIADAAARYKKMLGNEQVKCMMADLELATVHLCLKDNDAALKILAHWSNSNIYNKFYDSYIHALRDKIADLYINVAGYNEALPYLLAVIKETDDEFLLRSLMAKAGYCYKQVGKLDEANDYFSRLLELEKGFIRKIFSFLSEKERSYYWNESFSNINTILQMNNQGAIYINGTLQPSVRFNNYVSSSLMYNTALLSKGLLLESSKGLQRIVENSEDPEMHKLFSHLQQLRIKNSAMRQYHRTTQAELELLEEEISSTEKQLLSISKQYGDYMHFIDTDWCDVRNALKNNDVAIEFIKSTDINSGMSYYSAELVRNNYSEPKHIFLFAETDESKFEEPDILCSDLSLGKKIWARITPYVTPDDNIYFAPDGLFYRLGIEYLPINDSERMCDKYNMYRLSSTRQLILRDDINNYSQSAVLYGGLNYNTEIDEMQYYAANSGTRGKSNTSSVIIDLRYTMWRYLRGTLEEVRQIGSILTNNGYHTALFTDNEGVEETFKALSGHTTEIIHIATHGFYLPTEQHADQTTIDIATNISANNKFDDDASLLRSGLILSGANNKINFPEGLDDGILTAKEISLLDLRGTNLVVLSACQTGLGDISGEGVFGLPRAFKKAGVNSIIMSLWNVDDEATRLLMERFYENIINGKNKSESLTDAQNYLKNYGSGKYNNPKYWAAFILLDGIN